MSWSDVALIMLIIISFNFMYQVSKPSIDVINIEKMEITAENIDNRWIRIENFVIYFDNFESYYKENNKIVFKMNNGRLKVLVFNNVESATKGFAEFTKALDCQCGGE